MKINPIAPCGMNCSLCLAYQREKNHCAGCNAPDAEKVPHCQKCSIRNCPELISQKEKYCSYCPQFPCLRIKKIDKRYRTRYGVSFIENLQTIKKVGLDKYLKMEQKKWTCAHCAELLCIHRGECSHCGGINSIYPERKQ